MLVCVTFLMFFQLFLNYVFIFFMFALAKHTGVINEPILRSSHLLLMPTINHINKNRNNSIIISFHLLQNLSERMQRPCQAVLKSYGKQQQKLPIVNPKDAPYRSRTAYSR